MTTARIGSRSSSAASSRMKMCPSCKAWAWPASLGPALPPKKLSKTSATRYAKQPRAGRRMSLHQPVLAGDRLALARLLTEIENDTPLGRNTLNSLFAHTGKAHLIGVTGAPGTGKSSLVNQLALYYRKPPNAAAPRRVAI